MTETGLDRRQFLCTAACGCAGLFTGETDPRAWFRVGADVLCIGFASSPRNWSATGGVEFGSLEAQRTSELLGLGREVTWRTVTPDSLDLLTDDCGAAAIIGTVDEEELCRGLAALANSTGIPFINAGCRSDALRAETCGRPVFHVQASDRMYADALAAGADTDAAEAVLWHPSLERFGAEQLNARFREECRGAEMDGPAWAGWMAVKLVWEASLRARTTEAAGIRAYLERAGTVFDGHKGWPLSFRSWDHQLRQPLYLVASSAEGTRVVGEVPVRPPEGGAASAELLDRLGADASASTCIRMREGTS